jgi:hypothetical protein
MSRTVFVVIHEPTDGSMVHLVAVYRDESAAYAHADAHASAGNPCTVTATTVRDAYDPA